jgi:integrase
MSMTKDSTTTSRPAKPYPEFPLYAHNSGRWAKKIRGKTRFFGPWRDSHGALSRYLAEKDDLEAGREPQRQVPGVSDALTVEQMVFHFLDAKKLSVQSGELAARTWKEYESYGNRLIRVFGAKTLVERLGPADFKKLRADFQKTHKSLLSLKGDVGKSRLFFNWVGPGVHGQGYIDRLPRFGDAFRSPSQSALDREREEQPARVLAATQVRALLSKAGTKLKAMILLGVNCGFGNSDCAKLASTKLDLDHGWANFARTKNGIRRRNPLWPETTEALRAVLKTRKPPMSADYARQVFITKGGLPFHAYHITHEFEKLVVAVGMTGEEADFYDLRRTCASIGLQVGDDDAVRTILGHKRLAKDMLGVYNRLQVCDERLRRVTDHIHEWLFTGAGVQSQESGDGQPDAPSEPVA